MAPRMAVEKVDDALPVEEMGAGERQEYGARGPVFGQMRGQFQQRRGAAGHLGRRRQRGHHGHAVVIGLDEHGVAPHGRVGAVDAHRQVVRQALLPAHARAHSRLERALGQAGAQLRARASVQPESGHVQGDAGDLVGGLLPAGPLRGDEDDGARAQRGGMEPPAVAVELHEHDAALQGQAGKLAILAGAAVDQRALQAGVRDRGGADLVGPEAVQLVALTRWLKDQRGALVDRNDDRKGLARDGPAAGAQPALQVVRGAVGARIAGDARAARAQLFHRATEAGRLGGGRRRWPQQRGGDECQTGGVAHWVRQSAKTTLPTLPVK